MDVVKRILAWLTPRSIVHPDWRSSFFGVIDAYGFTICELSAFSTGERFYQPCLVLRGLILRGDVYRSRQEAEQVQEQLISSLRTNLVRILNEEVKR